METRELAHRASNGVEVTLLWRPSDDSLAVRVVDTTVPLELPTAPCSPDGIPAGRVSLIAGGRLASPVLDLVTATALGRAPTPAFRRG